MDYILDIFILMMCISFGQTHDYLIEDFIYSLHTSTISPRTCGVHKECVPFYRCKAIDADDSICGYPDTCCEVFDKITITHPIAPVDGPTQNHRCGYRSFGSKTTDSAENRTDFGEFPWFASLMAAPEKFICSAVIIAPTVVLTNADCSEKASEEFFVQVGEWRGKEHKNIQHRARRIVKVINHERYDGYRFGYNIAILIVKSPFQWEETVQPVCLPYSNMSFDESRCYFTNWVNGSPQNLLSKAILKRVDAPIVRLDQCLAKNRRFVNTTFIIEETEVCAGGSRVKSYDVFDNGAPLVCPVPGVEEQYFLVGIASRVIQRKDAKKTTYIPPKLPRIYTSVPLMLEWLHDKLTENGIDLSDFR